MKSFFKKLLIFTLPLVLLCYPLDIFLSKQLSKSNYYAQDEYSVWTDLYDGNVNVDIAIYGSSRAWVHVDPSIIESETGNSSYNLGIDGTHFWLQYLRHRVLIENNSKPKQIIFSLDLYALEKTTELYNSDQFLPYMLFNHQMKEYLDKYDGFTFADYYFPLVRFYGKKKALNYAFKNSIIPVSPDSGRKLGYMGMLNEWNKETDSVLSTIKHFEVKVDTEYYNLFDAFLKECQNNNIQVIFVYSPEYIGGQNIVLNRKEIMSIYRDFADRYNIPFLDYSNHEMSKNKYNFYNAGHLIKSAAEQYTSILVADLLKLDLIDQVKRPQQTEKHAAI